MKLTYRSEKLESNEKKDLLILAIENESSTTARIRQTVSHPQFAFSVENILLWPYKATPDIEKTILEKVASYSHIQTILMHRVILSKKLQQRFFSLGKTIIFDFDDAIYAIPSSSYVQEQKTIAGWTKRWVRWISRGRPYYAARYKPLIHILKRVQGVSAGNPHLAQFARQYCSNVDVVPTAVDVANFPLKQHHPNDPVVIGWYGSPDNQWYLDTITPALQKIVQQHGERVKIQVISSRKYENKELPFEWIPWNRENELQDMLRFDIGLMPLTDDEWARGKSGNKALYYLGLGIPAVVSPLGVNRDIVHHGEIGFQAQTTDEWVKALAILISNCELRQSMGMRGRALVVDKYSRETAVHALNTLIEKTINPSK